MNDYASFYILYGKFAMKWKFMKKFANLCTLERMIWPAKAKDQHIEFSNVFMIDCISSNICFHPSSEHQFHTAIFGFIFTFMNGGLK